MGQLRIDNKIITTPISVILKRLKLCNTSGKLKHIDDKAGSENIVVTCPFHSGGHEAKAACNIYIGDNLDLPYGYFRCFVCDTKGPFEVFTAGVLNSPIDFAKEWLLNNFDTKEAQGVRLADSIVLPRQFKRSTVKVLSEDCLLGFQDWCPYLAARKVSPETCKEFNLKYDSKNRQIIFPYYNEKGQLITLLKRAIDSKTFYIEEGIDKPLFGINKVVSKSKCILTEGLFDCILANQYGFPAMATLGNPAPTQTALINRLPLKHIYLMFDNDEKGRSFNARMHKELSSRFLLTDVNIQAPYKDIGDLTYEKFWQFIKIAEKNNV